jgi:hypothetical protein
MEPIWAIQFLGGDRLETVLCRFPFGHCNLPIDDEPCSAAAITNRFYSFPVEKVDGLGSKVGRNSSSLAKNPSAGDPDQVPSPPCLRCHLLADV